MAQRKASRQAASRRAAAAAAARFREREEKLEQLAADFLDAQESIERIGAKYEQKRAALARQQEAEEAAERARGGRAVRQMVTGQGVPKRDAAERLTVSLRQVNEALSEAGTAPSAGDDDVAQTAEEVPADGAAGPATVGETAQEPEVDREPAVAS